MPQHKYTLRRDNFDERDHLFARPPLMMDLPKEVDLRSGCSSVVDQGDLGSCTANAMGSGVKEFLLLRDNQWVPVSRLFLYYMERAIEGTINEDAGASIRTGMKVLSTIGVCQEKFMPYITSKFADHPSPDAMRDAINYKIKSYQRLLDIDGVKRCLYEGFPVAMGIVVYESFESRNVAKTGIVPMPDVNREKEYGGHALCIVGYKQIGDNIEDGHFIVRNSWGKDWGDKGYCYIPFGYVSQELMFDFWTAR